MLFTVWVCVTFCVGGLNAGKRFLILIFFRKFIFIGMRKEILPLTICYEDLLVQNIFRENLDVKDHK